MKPRSGRRPAGHWSHRDSVGAAFASVLVAALYLAVVVAFMDAPEIVHDRPAWPFVLLAVLAGVVAGRGWMLFLPLVAVGLHGALAPRLTGLRDLVEGWSVLGILIGLALRAGRERMQTSTRTRFRRRGGPTFTSLR